MLPKWSEAEDHWLTGDWIDIAPGVRARGYGLPNEEDCDEPVRIQIILRKDEDHEANTDTRNGRLD